MDLFEQVLHAIEGAENRPVDKLLADGSVEPLTRLYFGADAWIEQTEDGWLEAINFLAVILSAVGNFLSPDNYRSIVDGWAASLRSAAAGGEITPRNPVTLLPLSGPPDGWDWLVSIDDCDSFLKTQGMQWSCSEVLKHLLNETLIKGEKYHDAQGRVVLECYRVGYEPRGWKNDPAAPSGTPEKAAPPAPAVAPAAADDDGWEANAWRLADEIGMKKWSRGERQFSARSICEPVAAELGKGTTNNPTVWWGTQGPRSAGAIRTALKGWQFTPPNTGTNGTSCTE